VEAKELIIDKTRKRRRLKLRSARAGCPFCWEWLPPPEPLTGVFSERGCIGGRCECGAYFVVDETGRLGGIALMDLQALATAGDLDRALELRAGENCEIRSKPLTGATRSFGGRTRDSDHFGPRVWALKQDGD
jgi:hypothetical protein